MVHLYVKGNFYGTRSHRVLYVAYKSCLGKFFFSLLLVLLLFFIALTHSPSRQSLPKNVFILRCFNSAAPPDYYYNTQSVMAKAGVS